MCQKYILQIQPHQSFPFRQFRFKTERAFVRIEYPTLDFSTYQRLIKNINILSRISSPYIIPIHTVNEKRGNYVILDYEMIPQPLLGSSKIEESTFLQQTKCKIYKLFQQFAEKGVRCFPNAEQIGLDSKGEPKVYTKIDFEVVSVHEKKQLLAQYQKWTQKLFESIKNMKQSKISFTSQTSIMEYTEKFDKVLSEIQAKIANKRQSQHTRKFSLPKSDIDYSKKGTLISQTHLNRRKNSFNPIINRPESEKAILKKQRLATQYCEREKSMEEWSDSTKEGSLSHRVSQALLKTTKMFKVYEKSGKHRI